MPKLVKNGLYILTLVGGSYLICKHLFGTEPDNEWLMGALIVPLIAILAQSCFKERGNDGR